MAAPLPGGSGLLLEFSQSVRTVAADLAGREVTAWEIADELLVLHPEYGESQLRRFSPPLGRREPLERWLMLVASLFDRDTVGASPARVIDGRMTLRSLARLEPELGLLYRRWGIAARLADDVAVSRETVYRGWALPRRPSEWVELAVFGGPEVLAGPFALSPDGTLLAVASVEGDEYARPRPGTAHLWDVLGGSERAVLRGHRADLWSCTFSPDGRLLVTTSDDATARVWDVASGSERAVLRGHKGADWRGAVRSCAFSPEGSVLATAGGDGTARLWDAASGGERSVLRGHRDFLTRCAFSRDGSVLATSSFDGTARLWDAASGSERAVLRGHEGPLWWCAFSPDGSLLATASRDGTVRLWEVASGSEQSVLLCDDDGDVEWCTFSPDGTVLATGSWTPELWDVASGSRRSVLRGHDTSVMTSAFGPDGSVLATASRDGTVRLWDVASGVELSVLRHGDDLADVVRWCAFSPSGNLLITAAEARFPSGYVVRLWQQIESRHSPLDTPNSPNLFGDDIAVSLRLKLHDAARAGVIPEGTPEPAPVLASMASPAEYEQILLEEAERERRRIERRERERRQLERAVGLPQRDAPAASHPDPMIAAPTPMRRVPRVSQLSWLAIFLGSIAAGYAIGKWVLGWLVIPPEHAAGAAEEAEAEPDDVECTVFAPPTAKPGDSVLVQAFVHRPEQAMDAQAIATELDTFARRRAYRSLSAPVTEGSRLDFELRMPGVTIDEPVTSFVWRGRTEAVQFGVEVPLDAPTRSVTGTLDVSLDGAPVGLVKFTLRIEKGAQQPDHEPQGEHARKYSYAFISYSSRDRDEVLSRIQMLSIPGIEYFQDVMTLEPGDRWLRKLEAGIDRCDLFLLFWSKHAKESRWVKQEVEYALARQGGDDLAAPEIRPVILERVEPWKELSHLHFDDRVLYFMRRPNAG
jgi:WD40 repeat protein